MNIPELEVENKANQEMQRKIDLIKPLVSDIRHYADHDVMVMKSGEAIVIESLDGSDEACYTELIFERPDLLLTTNQK